MKFIKLGVKYSLKNSWWLALIWLLPSVFVGLLCGPYQIISFMNNYPTTVINDFGSIFSLILPFGWQKIVFALLGILLVSVFLSMAIGQTFGA